MCQLREKKTKPQSRFEQAQIQVKEIQLLIGLSDGGEERITAEGSRSRIRRPRPSDVWRRVSSYRGRCHRHRRGRCRCHRRHRQSCRGGIVVESHR